MHNIRTGLSFLRQAWAVGRTSPGLLKPSLAALLAGSVITLLALIPIGLVVAFLRKTLPGILLTGFMCAGLLCIQLACGKLGGLATTPLFHRRLSGNGAMPETGRELIHRSGLDLLAISAAFPLIALQRWLARKPADGAAPPQEAWAKGAYLVMPVLAVETLSLKDALQRTAQMVNNRLHFAANTIGVNSVNTWVYILLGGAGLIAGLGIDRLLHGTAGACFGVLATSLFTLPAIILVNFSQAAYHTCLYILEQSPDTARQGNLAWDMLSAALQDH
jgi:hypothetical protein